MAKRGKSDRADAAAICAAASRPDMRCVPVKGAERQAELAVLRLRELLVRQRGQAVNALRGQAVVLVGGRQTTVPLAPSCADMLRGQRDFTAAAGMRVAVTLTMPGQRPAQGRFTPRDQS